MNEFKIALEWFIYGFIAGWVFGPLVKILTKIREEAKIARDEWRNPR